MYMHVYLLFYNLKGIPNNYNKTKGTFLKHFDFLMYFRDNFSLFRSVKNIGILKIRRTILKDLCKFIIRVLYNFI